MLCYGGRGVVSVRAALRGTAHALQASGVGGVQGWAVMGAVCVCVCVCLCVCVCVEGEAK